MINPEYFNHLCTVAKEKFGVENINTEGDIPTVTIDIDEYVGLKRTEQLYDPAPWCTVGICEGLCKECRTTCPASSLVIERDKTAREYKVAMMLAIQEMVKYLELTEEQAKILYHHNHEIAKQFMISEEWLNGRNGNGERNS
jgi:ferredoxin